MITLRKLSWSVLQPVNVIVYGQLQIQTGILLKCKNIVDEVKGKNY